MRYALRFKPDPLDTALVQFSGTDGDFIPEEVGIIVNESYTGSALVMTTQRNIANNSEVKIKVGKLPEMRARIVWVKSLDKEILKVGVEYLE